MRSSAPSWRKRGGRLVSGTLLAASLLAIAACGSAAARPTISDAWVRATTAGADTSAAYLVIANPGSVADTLLSASSPAATSVELHQTSTDSSGMTGMAPMANLAIPAGGSVTLAPGGAHLMIMGLHQPLVAGGAIEVDLVFEHAGTIVVQAAVRPA